MACLAQGVKRFSVAALGAFVGLWAGWNAPTASAADFYRGKTVSIVIGYSPGGGYDAYARLLGRSMGKHIPGNPMIVPQNMPGAGSLKATMYLYEVAPKDGTVFGIVGNTEALAPLLTPKDAKFDATKFTWIGSITSDVSLCVSWHTSPIKTWADMLSKTYTVGGTGAGSDPDVYALAVKNIFNAKINLVTPYPGTTDIGLAMQRGEVDGLCGLSWSTIKTQHGDWLSGKKINFLVQQALSKAPDLTDVPLITEFAKNDEQLKMLKVVMASQAIYRPFFGPPGISDEHKEILRKAFADTMRDPSFLTDVKQAKFDVHPMMGDQIEVLLKEIYATPKDIVEKAAWATANNK
jgi:tripartite-type tricarboxylate transporter receptor subunit TctC